MSGFVHGSFRTYLVSLVLLTTLPFVGMTLCTGAEEQELAGKAARDEALRIVHLVSDDVQSYVGGAQQVLAKMSLLPGVIESDRNACDASCADLLHQYPQFNDLGAADVQGNVFCGARPFPQGLNAYDRPHFQRALSTGRFAVGDYQIGRVTGKPGVAFAQPVFETCGEVRAVVFAVLDLSWLNDLVVKAGLPKGAAFTVRDRKGTVLVRYPDPDKWVGRTASEAPILKTILAADREGTVESEGADGVQRLYAFAPLGNGSENGLYLSIGIPLETAYANVKRMMYRNLLGMGMVAILTLLVAWFGGGFLLVRHAGALLSATRRLSAGDLSARTGLKRGQGELQQLGESFDEMANSIQDLTGQLHRAEARYRTLVEQIPATLYIVGATEDYTTLYISPQVEEMLGFAPGEWLLDSNLWERQLHTDDRDRILEQHRRSRMEEGAFRAEYRMLHKDGRLVWVRDETVAIKDESGETAFLQGLMRDVTERKNAEKALRQSEAKFRALIETIPAAVMIVRGERLIYANPAAQTMTGYAKEELLKTPFWEIIHPDFRDVMEKTTQAILTGEPVPWRHEVKITVSDGRERWLDLSSVLIRCLDLPAILTVALDVTERKNAEDAVEELSRKNELILNAVSEGIFGLDLNGCTTFVNAAVERMTGWTAGELIGKPIHPVLHHSKADGSPYPPEECPGSSTIATGACHHLDSEVLWKKDGVCFPVDYSSTTMRDEEERIVGAVVVVKDVSERRRAEEDRLRLATAVEQSAESISITDTRGVIQYVNPSFERIMGYSRAEIVGKHARILKSDGCDSGLYKALRDTVTAGDIWSGHLIYARKDGSAMEVETTISPIRDRSGVIISHVAVQRDVTHKSQLEKQLRQAQKMEALGTMAGGIAHDFNNILGAILGYTELAMARSSNERSIQNYLEQVFRAGNRARDLVRQILTFSRPCQEERSPIQIGPLIKETVKLLRASLPSTIEIRSRLAVAQGEDIVLSIPVQVQQVLMNLCTNAAHAMREKGGVLEVCLEALAAGAFSPRGCSRIAEASKDAVPGFLPGVSGPFLKITVRDSGHGMERTVMDKIFDPFFTTKGPGEGSGMGLSVVHGIIKSHGGDIAVDSEPGKGTTFEVFLPKLERAAAGVKESLVEKVIPGGGERILYVDDDQALLHATEQHLGRLGYHVVACKSSTEALEVFRAKPLDFDLVITDHTMPHLTGAELAQEIISIRNEIPIILCSGNSQVLTPEKAKTAGIREVLTKPVLVPELARSIRVALGKGT